MELTTIEQNKPILVVWNEDKYLIDKIKLNYNVITMQSEIYIYLKSRGINCIMADELLSHNDINICKKKSEQISKQWSMLYGPDDISALLFSKITLLLTCFFYSEKVVGVFTRYGIKKVYCFGHNFMNQGIYSSYRIFQHILQDIYGRNFIELIYINGIIIPIRSHKFIDVYYDIKDFFRSTCSILRNCISLLKSKIKRLPAVDYAYVDKSIVFIASYDVDRDMNYIKQLRNKFKICVFFIDNLGEAVRISKLYNIVTYNITKTTIQYENNRFDHCIEYLLRYFGDFHSTSQYFRALIRAQDKEYKKYSNTVSNIFDKYRPSIVCTINAMNPLFRYIERSCINMNLKTVIMPHASMGLLNFLKFSSNENYIFLMPFLLNEKWYKNVCIDLHIRSIKNLFIRNEYPMENNVKLDTDKLKILFIFACASYPSGVPAIEGGYARINLLREIYKIFRNFSLTCEMYCKLHPALPEKCLYEFAGFTEANILPLDSNLEFLLKKIDLVICVNYLSSPTIQCVLDSIPVIQFEQFDYQDDENQIAILKKMLFNKYLYNVTNISDLYISIDKFINESNFRNDILKNQKKLLPYLEPSDNISLCDFIENDIINASHYFDE